MAIFDSKPLVYKHIPLVVSTVHPQIAPSGTPEKELMVPH